MLLRYGFLAALLCSGIFAVWANDDEPLDNSEAVPSLTLDQAGQYPIGLSSQWLEDKDRSLTPEQALSVSTWQPSASENLNFGFSHSAYWLKIPVQNRTNLDWMLWVQYSLLDRVELWNCALPLDNFQRCQYQQLGDQQPFSAGRSYPHPNLIFPLNLTTKTPNKTSEYLLLLRVETQGTQQLPIVITDSRSLENALFSQNIWRGGFYAVLLVLGLYNLIIFLTTKSRSYLYYSGFVLSFLAFHMVYEGSAFQLFWPNMPILNNYALPVLFALNMLLLSFLVPSFLNLHENQSKIFTLFRVYSALILVSVLMLPLMSYQLLVPIYNSFNIVLVGSALLVSLYFWIIGKHSARYFSLAWIIFFTGLMLADTRSLGLIPANFITLYSYQISVFLGAILLSLALSDRIIHQQQDQLNERQALLDSQEQAIEYLRDYEDLYQNSLTGKFQLDSEGYFSKSNASWRAILGYSNEQYFRNDNPKFNDLFADNKQRRKFWRKLREHGQLQAQVVAFVQPISGETVMVSITARKGNTDKVAWYGSGQDITENYLKEQALISQHKEKAAALRQLLAGTSEEMNEGLNSLRTAENYLDYDEKLNELDRQIQVTQGLTLVRQSIQHLSELRKLLGLSAISDKQYQASDINIRQWLNDWKEEQQEKDELLKLQVEVHSYLIDWPTYPEALALVLGQLLDHSRQRNEKQHQKGELKVVVEIRERGDFLELHFYDNGVAISQEDRHTFFMPFQATAEQDASARGLGLYQTFILLTELMLGFVSWQDEDEGLYLIVRFNLPNPLPSEDKTHNHQDK